MSNTVLGTEELKKVNKLPLVIQPDSIGHQDVYAWVHDNKQTLEQQLYEYGGILFRGFNIPTVSHFERFIGIISPSLEEYRERSTPRTAVQGNVYTSTEYPQEMWIPQHNENSYQHAWPMKIWFYSVECADEGGDTPIADSREIYRRLDPQIIKKFEEKKVMYVRNLGGGIDLSWQEVFQTDSKEAVEAYCKKAGMSVEWLNNDRLRTKSVRPAVARHPKTGEMIWFNQAHLFHSTSLTAEIRDYLIQTLGEENLTRNACYGDGTPIEHSVLDEIRGVYDEIMVRYLWEKNDVLLLDNMLTTHGRAPFKGKRKVVVAMSEVYDQY
ncbi:TauD/TfdA family dioxygenase [Paenibacillus sp. YSY-4.3]